MVCLTLSQKALRTNYRPKTTDEPYTLRVRKLHSSDIPLLFVQVLNLGLNT